MIIKSFEGATVSDAMKLVKKEFGAEAIILSTQEKSLPESDQKFYAIKAATSRSKEEPREVPPAAIESFQQTSSDEGRDRMMTILNLIYDAVTSRRNTSRVEEKLDELNLTNFEILNGLLEQKEGDIPDVLKKVYSMLSVAGISKKQLAELLVYLKKIKVEKIKLAEGRTIDDYIISQSIRWLSAKLKTMQFTSQNSKVHLFLGPSGSGKSSLIAKIAAGRSKDPKSTLIVTMDTAGVSQFNSIKTYTKIMNIPLISVGSVKELLDVVSTNQGYQSIYVDNVGGFPFTKQESEAIKHFSNTEFPIDFHLVLSLSEKVELNDLFVRRCSMFGISSLNFSRLDYTANWGDVFNLSVKWKLPVSYLSLSPDVSSRAEVASKERLIGKYFSL